MGRATDKLKPNMINMPEKEIETLKELASDMDSVVEVGCWIGDTTKELLKQCNNVYAVDNFKGSNGENEITSIIAHGRDIHQEFLDNVGESDKLTILKGDSIEMAHKFNGKKVDMVFIDAGHDYEEVKADIDSWLPKCTKVISGHDYNDNFPGVKKAVDEKFDNVTVKDSIWSVILQKIGEQ